MIFHIKVNIYEKCTYITQITVFCINWLNTINSERAASNRPTFNLQTTRIFFIPPSAPYEAEKVNDLTKKLDSTRHKASEICLRPPLHIYFHKFSR